MYVWRDQILHRNIDKAEDMLGELATILKLPYETELNLVFDMIQLSLMLRDKVTARSMELIEDSLVKTKNHIAQYPVSNEVKYYYYCNKGFLEQHKGDYTAAVTTYKKAVYIENKDFEKDPSPYCNLALCYSSLGMSYKAVRLQLETYNLFDHNKMNVLSLRIDNNLAVDLMRIGDIEPALKLLDKALSKASNNSRKDYVSIALHNTGVAYLLLKDYEKALGYLDNASSYLIEGSNSYFENLYSKIYCFIAMKKKDVFNKLLKQAKELSKDSEHFSLFFESLSHIVTLKESSSIEFITNKTIPYLVENYFYSDAIGYCDELIKVFTKSNLKTKTLETKALRGDILNKIFYSGEL